MTDNSGTQRVFWRNDAKNREKEFSGSINSQGEFVGLLNITGTVKRAIVGRTSVKSATGTSESVFYNYTSSFSGTLSSSYGMKSILPIDVLETPILLLTASFIGEARGRDESLSSFIEKSSLTQSIRLNTFKESGELNDFTWIDCFITGINFPNVDSGSSRERANIFVPQQLVRNSIFSLFNNYALFGSVDSTLRSSPSLFFIEESGSNNAFPKPRIKYCAFLGGFESGSRNWDYPNAPFELQPSSSLPISSSLDFGLRYAIEEMTSGSKRPWFDSYEKYLDDIKGLVKDYSVIPEFRISEHMNYYVSQSGGNFRAKNTSFLSIDGIGHISRSSDTENTIYNEKFFKTYINSDDSILNEQIKNDNNKITKLDKIIFKVSGIKKLLPYNGFYPINRTVQLANLYSNFVNNSLAGGILNLDIGENFSNQTDNEFTFKISVDLTGNISKFSTLQTGLEPFFSPGILYNTIKSGIAVDWPSITGSRFVSLQDINRILPEPVKMFYSVTGNIRSQINNRVQFTDILEPINVFETNKLLTSSVTSFQISDSEVIRNINKYLTNVYFSSHFDFYNIYYPIATTLNSVPFIFRRNDAIISPEYSMAMNNFLAETVRFFLKDEKMLAFVSEEESRWKSFDSSKTYYFDLVMKKSQDLVMIEAYSGSNIDFYAGYDSRDISGSKSTMNGRYFGYPCAKTLLTGAIGYLVSGNTRPADAAAIHYDPAYSPYTPPYFEGEAVLRFRFTPQISRKHTLHEIFSGSYLEDIFLDLSSSVDPGSVAIANKMSIRNCVNIFGITKNKEVEYDLLNPKLEGVVTKGFRAKTIKDSVSSDKNVWVISPKMETPVLDFSNQPFITKTGSYWRTGGFGRGMWSGYGSVPSGSKGIYLELRDSFPQIINQPNSNTGSLLGQIGFRQQSEKIGQLAERKEISEAIVAIPYIDYEIKGKTININGHNFIKINKKIFNIQRQAVESRRCQN